MTAQNVANTLWARATLGWQPQDSRMRSALEVAAMQAAPRMIPQEVADTSWAMAKLGWQAREEAMTSALEVAAMQVAPSMNAEQVGSTLWAQAKLGLDAHALVERAGAYAGHAMGYLGATAYLTLYVFIGFVVALMYLFERDEVDAWLRSISSHSLQGTLIRWLGHVADAIGITLRLQVVVAIFNAVFTLPLLLLLGLPNIPLLCLLVLLGGMIPVVGGALSGLVLCLVAYDAQGFVGVAVFLAVTFVLGKVESYYLSPRLTAEHVQLPGLILVESLLMFETLFGFWGLFMSFPALYIGLQISREFSKATSSSPAITHPKD